MLKLTSIMVGTSQLKTMSEFYENVLNKPADMIDQTGCGWMLGGCFFGIGEHSEVKGMAKEPQRIILNLETEQVKEEFERIKGLGAKVIKEPYDMGGGMLVATFSDPDGNYFQLMSPWKES